MDAVHPVPTLWDVIGTQLEALRIDRNLTQELLAFEMRALGIAGWTRNVARAAVHGKRQLTVEEILGLACVFRVPVMELLGAAEVVRVGALTSSSSTLASWLVMDPPEARGDDVERRRRKEAESLALEKAIARRYRGVTPGDVVARAYGAFGRSVTEQREAKLAGESCPVAHVPPLRKQIGRELEAELATTIEPRWEPGRKTPGSGESRGRVSRRHGTGRKGRRNP